MKKTALRTVIASVVFGLASFGAAASDTGPANSPSAVLEAADSGVRSYTLQDESRLYVFKDGKMAMENRFGRPLSMADGHPMETVNGQTVVMKGNEIWRLQEIHAIHRGG